MKIREFLFKNLHQSWCVVFFSVGVIFGVVMGLVFRINFFSSWWFLILALGLFILSYLRPKLLFVSLMFVAGMVVSFFRVANELAGENYVRQFFSQNIIVSGVIDGDAETDEAGTNFKIKDLCFGESGEYKTAGSIYVSGFRNSKIMRGDTVVLSGKLSEGFGIYAGYMYHPVVKEILHPEPGDFVLRIRDWFSGRVRQLVDEPESDLGLSYLLGMKSGLPDKLSESLRVVGLTHIVVASGAHLSILVEVAKKIFGRVSRFAGLLFSSLFVVFFMAVVGFTPSILRAGIMTLLTIIGWYVGRKIAPWRIILIVAAGTLVLNPMFIINLGWLLSFASFAGIMILSPKITGFFYGVKKPGFVANIIITTIAATFMTLPIVLYFYGTVSLISVVANLLILPTLPYAMGLVFLTGVANGIPAIETIISFMATKLLDFHIFVVNFFGQMENFLVKIEPFNGWVFLIYGLLVVGLLIGKVIKLRENKYYRGKNNMSGHSKWATTKRQKAVVDAKRGALFTKIGNQIAIAARGGVDPAMNPSLAMVLEKARLANMPKANIERAIARVADKSAAALIEEVYEAYGPGGVGIVIEVATDNKNRTMPEVRHTLDKNGGRMAEPGSVMFQFTRKGVIEISEKGEDALMATLEAGAEDASEEDDGIVVYTAASDLMKVRAALADAGLTVTSAELSYVPNSYVPVDGENAEKLEKLLSSIDDLDDVTNVYTNAE